MANVRSGERLSARAFRALLALYPAVFRDEYGRELSLAFIDRYRDASGPWDRLRLWQEALVGVLTDAPKEHARMILHDLRDASRTLRRHALVTATIVITLGLGIGANTAVFSLLNAITLRSLQPVQHGDQLYVVNSGRYVAGGPEAARLSGPMMDLLRQAAPEGVELAAMSRGIARVYTRRPSERETVPASLQLVSPSFFSVLDVSPALGRLLPEGSNASDSAETVAVLSYAYWQRRFGGSPDVVGSTIAINGASFTIVGIAERDFAGVWLETPVDIWASLTAQPIVHYSQSFTADGADFSRPWLTQSQIWWLHVIARVPSGQVSAVTNLFNASVSQLAGQTAGVVLQPVARGLSKFRQQFSLPLVVLMVMATLVLLTACANVANLLLARAVDRQRELAVRMALGAGRGRLFHQLLIESLLIVVMSGAAAVAFVRWTGNALLHVAADGPPPFPVPIDLRVLVFAASAALLSIAAFGVWPAWRATRVDPVSAFKGNGRSLQGRRARPARALVVLQVALSLTLVTATGLFARSFRELLRLDLGFEPARLLSVGIDPRLAGVPPHDLPATYRRILDDATRLAGVESAALAMCGLQGTCALEDGYRLEGYEPRTDEVVAFSVNVVTPAYFSTMGMPIIAGRALSESDLANTTSVAVVNRTLADRYFGEWRQALGRRFGLSAPNIEIVGVVEDARGITNLKAAAMPTVFVPLAQRPVVPRELEVRTSVEPAAAMAAVRRAIADAAPGMPIESMEPAVVRVQRSLGQERLMVLLTSCFSALALGLAAFGLFGIQSYAIARRTPEIGLRIALGAAPSEVVLSIVRDGLRLVLYGVLIGLPLVAIGGTLASGLVFGVSPYDPLTLAVAVVVLAIIGVTASAGPARRASRLDPMIVLRQE
ncbi:MAG TPA: ABC transporter permease [Vicinamibacterales bacterium]|nr:ABC transporter permease [Vicinamibacterales bacterium]